MGSNWRSLVAAVAALVAVSVFSIQTPQSESAGSPGPVTGAPVGGVPGNVTEPGPGTPVGTTGPNVQPTGGASPGAPPPTKSNLECAAGKNGGNTDVGVTGNRIRLASTNVRSGVGSSFLGESHYGLEAVVARVNAAGGICGRLLELRLVDDGWDAARGRQYIENFIQQGYFALPVVPSSEGLTAAIKAGIIKRAGIPVVGTDGMLKEQYQDPWVWPVATATVSTMRIMAQHAYQKGARTFGIVYDNQYKFGIEGSKAFKTFVERLPGAKLKAFTGIPPLRPSYGPEAQSFNESCEAGDGKPCDFVAFLLEPSTAEAWVASQPEEDGKKKGFGSKLSGGAQPLFNERFARNCGQPCNGMVVWTGYNPPVGRLERQKDVAEYIRDIRALAPSADISNQFLEGAYLGMRVFVHALEKVGPELTRARLKAVMDNLTYSSGLSSDLVWSPGNRFANLGAQGFEIVVASGSFAGFRDAGTSFLRDPTPGVVPG